MLWQIPMSDATTSAYNSEIICIMFVDVYFSVCLSGTYKVQGASASFGV